MITHRISHQIELYFWFIMNASVSLADGMKCKTPPNARANSRVRVIKIICYLEVTSLGFKFEENGSFVILAYVRISKIIL